MSAARSVVLPVAQQQLKAATRAGVRAFGGGTAAGLAVGRAQSRISDWGNVNVPEFMPLDAVLTIEESTQGLPGWPHITTALAAATGHVLVRLPDAGAPARGGVQTNALSLNAQCAREFGEISGVICAALADGMIDAEEAGRVRREIAEAMQQLATMDALMAQIEGGAR